MRIDLGLGSGEDLHGIGQRTHRFKQRAKVPPGPSAHEDVAFIGYRSGLHQLPRIDLEGNVVELLRRETVARLETRAVPEIDQQLVNPSERPKDRRPLPGLWIHHEEIERHQAAALERNEKQQGGKKKDLMEREV